MDTDGQKGSDQSVDRRGRGKDDADRRVTVESIAGKRESAQCSPKA